LSSQYLDEIHLFYVQCVLYLESVSYVLREGPENINFYFQVIFLSKTHYWRKGRRNGRGDRMMKEKT